MYFATTGKKPSGYFIPQSESWIFYDPDSDWGTYFKLAWGGPALPQSSSSYRDVVEQLKKIFTCYNIIRECVDRQLTGAIGRAPAISASSDDLVKRLNAWMKRQRKNAIHTRKLDPFREAVLHWYVDGEAYLRLYVDPKTDEIKMHRLLKHQVDIVENAQGEIEKITYLFNRNREADGREVAVREVQTIEGGRTIFEYFEGEAAEPYDSFSLELNRQFTILVMKRSPLITRDVRALQTGLNNELTLMGQNSKFAGFLREIMLNSQPPGEWEQQADGSSVFVPSAEPLVTGPGQTTFVSGLPRYDASGNIIGYETPSVVHKNPADPSVFTTSALFYKECIYAAFNQSHILGSSQAQSGVSREQARADYKNRLEEDCQELGFYLDYILSVFLLLSEDSTTIEQADSVSSTFFPDPGAPAASEIQQIRENYKQGLIDHETALLDMGYEDPAAIIEALRVTSTRAPITNPDGSLA